jgi:hypothetical protein
LRQPRQPPSDTTLGDASYLEGTAKKERPMNMSPFARPRTKAHAEEPAEAPDRWRGPMFGTVAVALAFMGALLYLVAIGP